MSVPKIYSERKMKTTISIPPMGLSNIFILIIQDHCQKLGSEHQICYLKYLVFTKDPYSI
jgi:hypothetical protein